MKSHRIKLDPDPMAGVLRRGGNFGHRHSQWEKARRRGRQVLPCGSYKPDNTKEAGGKKGLPPGPYLGPGPLASRTVTIFFCLG